MTLALYSSHAVSNKTRLLAAEEGEDAVEPSLINLPPEILLQIFAFLSPADLCHLSQVHSLLLPLAFNGPLWSHLHPVRWSQGHVRFFPPLPVSAAEMSGEGEEEGESVHDVIMQNNIAKQVWSGVERVDVAVCHCR